MRFLGDFKLAQSTRALLRIGGERPRTGGDERCAVPDADVPQVSEGIITAGGGTCGSSTTVRRAGVVVRFEFRPETDLLLLSELEAVRWVEPVPLDVDDDDSETGSERVGSRPHDSVLTMLHGEGRSSA